MILGELNGLYESHPRPISESLRSLWVGNSQCHFKVYDYFFPEASNSHSIYPSPLLVDLIMMKI